MTCDWNINPELKDLCTRGKSCENLPRFALISICTFISINLFSVVVGKCLVAAPPILLANPLGRSLQIPRKQSLIFVYFRNWTTTLDNTSGKEFTNQSIGHFFIAQFAQLWSSHDDSLLSIYAPFFDTRIYYKLGRREYCFLILLLCSVALNTRMLKITKNTVVIHVS